MVDGIGSIGTSGMQRPNPRDFFKKVDSDGSGGVSQAELQGLADKMGKKTGQTLDVSDDAFAGYDSDGSGSLSAEELKGVLDNSGFGPSHGIGEGMESPPLPPKQALDSYDSNASSASSPQDTLASLISNLKSLLEQLTSTADGTGSDAAVSGSGRAAGHSAPKGLFDKVDSDASGGVSQDEMKTLAENLKKMTGQTLDVSDDAFKSYDGDGDGSLSADELKAAMDKNGFQPPQGPPPGGMRAGGAQDRSASLSLDDQVTELKKLLETLTAYSQSAGSGTDSLLSVTT